MERLEKREIVWKIFAIWAFVIMVCHTLLAAYRYVIPYDRFTPALRWAGLGLIGCSFIMLIGSLVVSKAARQKIKRFFRRIWCFELAMLIGVFLWFLLSCYMNGMERGLKGIYFYVQDWILFDTVVCFFLLFPLARAVGAKRAKTDVEILIHVVVITYSMFTIVCLWHIFHLEVLTFPSGEQGGITRDVQLMLGQHYNLTGMIAATMFCLCVYMVFMQKTIIRVLYILLGAVQLVVVYLCNSRTVFVVVWFFVAVVGFACPWRLLKGKKSAVRVGVSMLMCAGCAGLFWIGRTGMFILFEIITHFNETLARETAAYAWRQGSVSLATAGRRYDAVLLAGTGAENARKLTNLSNRTEVWKAALKVMSSSPKALFFGVTPYEVTESIWEIGNYHVEKVAHAHNILLQIGTGLGLPAMIMYMLFLGSIALRCVRVMFGKSGVQMKHSYLIAAVILCFLLMDMAEVYLLTRFSVMACFFYLFCGWVVELDRS